MAKRYSKLPSDLLDLDITDFQFNILVASVAIDKEVKDQQKKGRK